MTGPDGLNILTRPGLRVALARELRADQYGWRTLLRVDGIAVKFEIVLKARIDFDPPRPQDEVAGIAWTTASRPCR